MASRDLYDVVESSEVRFIGFAEVVVLEICSTTNKSQEGPQSVGSCGIDVIRIVMTGTRYVDPPGSVESIRLAIGEIKLSILLAQSSHQSLRSIADDEKRYVLLVYQIPAVGAHLEGKDRGDRAG